jgi:hypothetical protein
MPAFLENKLKSEYGQNSKIPYKVMNSIGAMAGPNETPKGAAMEKKHEAKMDHMRITPAENGGHTVEHHYKAMPSGKSGAFMEHKEPETHVFGAGEGAKMLGHLKKHLGIGAAPAAGTQEAEQEPAPHDVGQGAGEEIEEGE